MKLIGGRFVVQPAIDTSVYKGNVPLADDFDDDARTTSTEDPVGLAMAATLTEDDDDDDDEEQILYPQAAARGNS